MGLLEDKQCFTKAGWASTLASTVDVSLMLTCSTNDLEARGHELTNAGIDLLKACCLCTSLIS